MTAKQFLAAAILAITVALGGGCASEYTGPGSAAGTMVYSSGVLKARDYTSYERGWSASLGALGSLGYAVTETQKDAVQGKITARAQGDKKITVEVFKDSGTVTEFHIRVGTWGDQGESEQILQAIRQRL